MKKNYLLSADLIRSLAIVGVLLSHITIAVSGRPDFFNGISWFFAVVLGTLSRAAIPFFILLSGYFILDKTDDFKSTLRRTFNRIVVPLVFWTLIYTYFLGGMSFIGSLKSLPYQLYETNVFELYFLEITIGLYLISPMLSAYLKNISFSSQRLVAVFFLILGCVQAALQFLTGGCSDNIFTIWIPYLGIFLAGYVFGHSKIKSLKPLTIISMVFFGITLITNYTQAFLYFKQNINILNAPGCVSNYPNYFLSINVLLMSIPIFLVLLKMDLSKIKDTFLATWIKVIAECSYGIFLVHLLILQLIDTYLHLFDPIAPAWLYIVLKFLVIFLLSLGITLIIKRTPVLKKVIGEK